MLVVDDLTIVLLALIGVRCIGFLVFLELLLRHRESKYAVLALAWLAYTAGPVWGLAGHLTSEAVDHPLFGYFSAIGTWLIIGGVWLYYRVVSYLKLCVVIPLTVAALGIAIWIYPDLSGVLAILSQLMFLAATLFIVVFKRRWFLAYGGNSYYWLVPIVLIGLFHAVGFEFLYADVPFSLRLLLTVVVNVSLIAFFLHFEYNQTLIRLAESEETFAGFFNQGNIGMAITSWDKQWRNVNKKLCEMLGYSQNELTGMTWTAVTVPEDLEAHLALFNQMLAGEIENYEVEKRFITKNQRIIDTLVTGSCIRSVDGSVDRVLVTIQDISDRKAAEEKLKVAQAKLFESEKMSAVGILTAGIAHELNNPLMGVLNYTQYVSRKLPKGEKLHRILADAERATRDCIQIVRNLLVFSHADTRDQGAYRDVAFSEMVDRVLGLLSYRVKKENISVTKDIPDDDCSVHVNQLEFQQVLLNLFSNAIDAMEASDRKKLKISMKPLDGRASITVEDSGCGIPPEMMSKIYDPFYTSKPVGKGTGLGLSVSYGIITEHRGAISCESRVDRGTRFSITLPMDGPAAIDGGKNGQAHSRHR